MGGSCPSDTRTGLLPNGLGRIYRKVAYGPLLDVFILDTRLRADALNVTVTKEVKDASGNWTGAPVAAQTETDLENAILTKARQLNLANAN